MNLGKIHLLSHQQTWKARGQSRHEITQSGRTLDLGKNANTGRIKCKNMARLTSQYATFSRIEQGNNKFWGKAKRKQESSPLLRSAARAPRRADDAETASSSGHSCTTPRNLCCIAPPSRPSLSKTSLFSFASPVRDGVSLLLFLLPQKAWEIRMSCLKVRLKMD